MASQLSRIFPFLIITLCCIGAVEGGYSVLEYYLNRGSAEETAAPETPAVKDKAAPVQAGVKPDYSIILTRNLFGQQYKNENAEPAPAVDVAANLEKSGLDVVLVGTIDGSAGTHRAIIFDKKTKKQDLFKEGDSVKGANVKEILRGKVILNYQGKEELLDMSEAATVRPAVKAGQDMPPVAQPLPVAAGAGPMRAGPTQVAVTTEIQPGAEAAPAAAEEAAQLPPEPQGGPAAEAAAPGVQAPVQPGGSPQAAAPDSAMTAKSPEAPSQNVVRPRIIRPYRQ